MVGRGSIAVLVLCACGDPRDVQVPLLPDDDPTATPMFAQAPPQAFTSIGIRNADSIDAKACPLSFALSLGSSCDRINSGEGTCSPLRSGDDALVQCVVRPRAGMTGIYDVDLLLVHSQLPRLAVVGPMGEGAAHTVTLQVITPEEIVVDAECVAEAIAIQPGNVQFRLRACNTEVTDLDASRCDLSLSAGFENCER